MFLRKTALAEYFQIRLSDSARADFGQLDGSIKNLVAKQLKALETNPFKGEALGNKAGIDLTGYYKLYVCKKQVRIIYRVENHELIVCVVGIGRRDNLDVYKSTYEKLKPE